MAGPRYNWFVYNQANVPYVIVDNVGWTTVAPTPEPSALGLALVAGGAWAAARRRQRS
jgi:hypothetical protein